MKFESSSTGNRIYNNFFNSTLNYNQTGSTGNFFNTTKTLGTNIVGGDYIGGNYWGFLNGTGFSETCTDSDNDDICDVAYNLSDGSYDYLPLKLISFTLPTLPESPYTGGSSGSYSSSVSTVTAQKETQPISASSGGSASFSVKSKSIDIRNITLKVKTNITNASLTIQGVEIGNFTIPFPTGNLYKAFSITTKAISNEQLENVTIDFRVNKTKLSEFNASYENVLLYRIPTEESLWQSLPTVSISEDDVYYYFSSISPGFSTFVIFIAEKTVECSSNQTRCLNQEVQVCSNNNEWETSQVCDYNCDKGKCVGLFSSNLILIYSIAGFLIAVLIYYFVMKKKKLENNSETIENKSKKVRKKKNLP
jgi:PGF-pre-PGF domain-containing protein